MPLDNGLLYNDSSAKYAAAFFMSRSIFTRDNSDRKRADFHLVFADRRRLLILQATRVGYLDPVVRRLFRQAEVLGHHCPNRMQGAKEARCGRGSEPPSSQRPSASVVQLRAQDGLPNKQDVNVTRDVLRDAIPP